MVGAVVAVRGLGFEQAAKVQSISISGKAMFVGILLVVLQILDGYLTSLGMSRFGIEMEGNLLLRSMMEHFGSDMTLAIAKTFAIGVVAALTLASKRVPWVTNAMGGVACFYIVFAIIPWTYILFVEAVA